MASDDKIRDLCAAAIDAEKDATAKEQAPDYDRSAFFDGNQDDAYEAGEDRGATSGAAVLARKVLDLLGAIADKRPPCPGEGWEWDDFALQWHQPGAKGPAIGRAF